MTLFLATSWNLKFIWVETREQIRVQVRMTNFLKLLKSTQKLSEYWDDRILELVIDLNVISLNALIFYIESHPNT